MIDLNPSTNDSACSTPCARRRSIARKYARYYDENEHEFPPDELPEAKDHPELHEPVRRAQRATTPAWR